MTAFRTLDYLKYRGGWDLSVTYVTNDVVTLNSVAYVARGENSNSQPPSLDWVVLAQGTPGTPGAPGSQGVQGAQGTQGSQGNQGSQGPQGSQGTTGAQGSQGTQGSQGNQGNQGGTGSQGTQGNQGTQGSTGLAGGVNWRGTWSSVTAYAQGDGVTFSGQSYLALTSTTNNQPNTSPTQWQVFTGSTGPQGPQGFQGTQGVQGTQGTQGRQGFQGFQGTQGFQGVTGSSGSQGSSGATGSQGPQGTTGTPVPVGSVIDWWRPSNVVPVPAGFAIPTGQTLTSGQHSFPGVSGSVILPDLRNKMILGADVAKADGTAAPSAVDGASGAPGINGSGGSNFRDLTHSHSVDVGAFTSGAGGAVSQNTGSAGADTVSTSSAGGATVTTGNNSNSQNIPTSGGALNVAGSPHTHSVTVPGHTHNVSTSSHVHAMNVSSHTHSINPPSANTSGGLGVFDIHPQYIGMLKLMRVQ